MRDSDGSAMVGPEEILASQTESFARLRATQHMISDHVIDIEGDLAQVRANITAMHLWKPGEVDPNSLESYFLTGSVLRSSTVRTPIG